MADPQHPEDAETRPLGLQAGDHDVAAAAYLSWIEPARLTLTIRRPDGIAELLMRVGSRLDAEAAPAVAIERLPAAVRFTAQTWRPILVTRITDALDAELGPGRRKERFSAPG